jgi:hypothetical protein
MLRPFFKLEGFHNQQLPKTNKVASGCKWDDIDPHGTDRCGDAVHDEDGTTDA